MNQNNSNLHSLAFVPPDTLRFSELIELVNQDWTLPDTRRRDMVSGLRRVAKALGLPSSDVPCYGRWLQPRLAKIGAISLGISSKSWQNAVSDARSAMALFGIVERRFSRISDLPPDWKMLWGHVLASNDNSIEFGLCRFVYFLGFRTIPPHEVCSDHAIAYREALICNEISKSPDVAYRAAINAWNLAVARIPEWPRITLSLPPKQILFRLEDKGFPENFIKEVDAFIAKLGTPDPLADDHRLTPLRPATLTLYRRRLMRLASELVHSGFPQQEIIDLRTLLDPAKFERALRMMLSRTDNKSTSMFSALAAVGCIVGKTIQIPMDEQEQIKKLAGRVAVKQNIGITKKNRARLRPLQNEKNQRRLILLPDRIFGRPNDKAKPYLVTLAREDALAIAILLVCPIRIKNVAEIRLDQHLQRPGNGQVFLVFDEDEVKNSRSLEFELPHDVVKMIDRHLATRSPHVCDRARLGFSRDEMEPGQ